MTDYRAVAAARNNGDWHATMFDVHQLRYERSNVLFTAVDPPPAYHSDSIVLTPHKSGVVAELVRERAGQGFTIKDSFGELDFEVLGLTELFTASWIWCDDVGNPDVHGWENINSIDRLMVWEAAWQANGSPVEQRQFPDQILGRSDVAIFGRLSSQGYDAGVIANRSTDSVGFSNAFGPTDSVGAAIALCSAFGDGMAVVGYESGEDLEVALASGFVATGQLRVGMNAAEAPH